MVPYQRHSFLWPSRDVRLMSLLQEPKEQGGLSAGTDFFHSFSFICLAAILYYRCSCYSYC